MTRPDHPRLVKVLAEAWAAPAAGIDIDDTLARELIEGIPPDIADRLEAALDPGCMDAWRALADEARLVSQWADSLDPMPEVLRGELRDLGTSARRLLEGR